MDPGGRSGRPARELRRSSWPPSPARTWTGSWPSTSSSTGTTRPGVFHEHLAILAVRPDRQGQGIGTALLDARHADLEDQGIPAYLEASDERTRRLYLAHGYTDRGSPIELADGVRMYPMWREPRTGRTAPDNGRSREGAALPAASQRPRGRQVYPGLRAARSARHPAGREREAPRRLPPPAGQAGWPPGPLPAGGERAAAREQPRARAAARPDPQQKEHQLR